MCELKRVRIILDMTCDGNFEVHYIPFGNVPDGIRSRYGLEIVEALKKTADLAHQAMDEMRPEEEAKE